jgi:hypothetical protein
MRVEWAIPCLSAGLQNNLVMIQGGCFNRAVVQQFPGEVRFIITLRLVGQGEDFAEDAPRGLTAHLLGPDMDEINRLEFEAPTLATPATHPEGWEIAAHLFVVVRFEAESEGSHTLDFYVNGKLQAGRSVAIWVASNEDDAPDSN